MGVIKKKTSARSTEGGVKFVCDVCSSDVTATVRIRCAEAVCHEFDLCVSCFSEAKTAREHDPATHAYQVIEQHSIPIFTEDWGADEELALLEGAETYGLGSWADIADHIGGFRTKDEVRDHYLQTYIYSSKFPLPEHCSPADKELSERIPRDVFQARKKRRIEERKEEAKNAPPATPKQKPTASVPSCHEVQGYMPGRLEFETEYFNEAEEAVQHMQFDPGDGVNPRTGEMEPEMELKMAVMDIYNSRLDARVERKKIIFEHNLLEYRKNAAADKKRTKEERDLLNKAKPFARMMKHDDFVKFCDGLTYELQLRQAIAQLYEWRANQIDTLQAGEKYEQEKQQRQTRGPPLGQFDRLSSNRLGKPTPPFDTPTAASLLTAPDLPERLKNGGLSTPPPEREPNGATTNGVPQPQYTKAKFVVKPLPNSVPLKFGKETVPDLQLLTPEEREICSVLRIMPKSYNAIKEHMIREALKHGGALKKKVAKETSRIDVNRASQLFEFFVHNGWIARG
ncbi:transcriptional adaptor 2 [Sporormia fimetaria CBS 119925]|uniref:Transcriptional adapter 2 n=1 Tax=Sporormia fimetaria CBS 119925 TaxID=1340428 RepID=A0A6A6VG09_9PLEO|nr:transcriptional adaptor 2 [Sporormia fimetaria CBS 119925]